MIPRWLWSYDRVKAGPRFLLAWLWTWAKRGDPAPFVYRSLDDLVEDTGQAKRVIERQLEALYKDGLIVRDRQRGRFGWVLMGPEIGGPAGNVGPPETSSLPSETGGRNHRKRREDPPVSSERPEKKEKKSERAKRPDENGGPLPLEAILAESSFLRKNTA